MQKRKQMCMKREWENPKQDFHSKEKPLRALFFPASIQPILNRSPPISWYSCLYSFKPNPKPGKWIHQLLWGDITGKHFRFQKSSPGGPICRALFSDSCDENTDMVSVTADVPLRVFSQQAGLGEWPVQRLHNNEYYLQRKRWGTRGDRHRAQIPNTNNLARSIYSRYS